MFWFGKNRKPRRGALAERPADKMQHVLRRVGPPLWMTSLWIAILFAILTVWLVAFCPGLTFQARGIKEALLQLVLCLTVVGTVGLGLGLYLGHFERSVIQAPTSFFFSQLVLFGMILSVLVLEKQAQPVQWMPVLLFGMFLGTSWSVRFSLGMAFCLLLLVGFLGLLRDARYLQFLAFAPGLLLAISGAGNIRQRVGLVHLGALSGLWAALLSVAVMAWPASFVPGRLSDGAFLGELGRLAGYALANGILSGFIMTGILPVLERIFGIPTNLRLLELSDLNQPVLRRMSMEAPGTYHHSLRVSQLSEAAAQAIGANALLARVGSYFHDLGKIVKPQYFVENDASVGQMHKNLTPSMSAIIVRSHVKEGIELARRYRLPEAVIDFIPGHHGTTVVQYFYSDAVQRSDPDSGEHIDPASFRYSGPKPQTREVAIGMLADSIEAASRTLEDPNPSRLETLVRKIVMEKLVDGQFEESNLTMRELKAIEDSFLRTLIAMHHQRIKYPEFIPSPTKVRANKGAS